MREPLILPWPAKALNPNARTHWRPKAAAAKAYRHDAWWAAMAWIGTGLGWWPSEGSIAVTITFRAPDKRSRDIDNMLASIKPAIDGLADAMHVNDSRFAITLRRGEPIKGGAVEIEVSA